MSKTNIFRSAAIGATMLSTAAFADSTQDFQACLERKLPDTEITVENVGFGHDVTIKNLSNIGEELYRSEETTAKNVRNDGGNVKSDSFTFVGLEGESTSNNINLSEALICSDSELRAARGHQDLTEKQCIAVERDIAIRAGLDKTGSLDVIFKGAAFSDSPEKRPFIPSGAPIFLDTKGTYIDTNKQREAEGAIERVALAVAQCFTPQM